MLQLLDRHDAPYCRAITLLSLRLLYAVVVRQTTVIVRQRDADHSRVSHEAQAKAMPVLDIYCDVLLIFVDSHTVVVQSVLLLYCTVRVLTCSLFA